MHYSTLLFYLLYIIVVIIFIAGLRGVFCSCRWLEGKLNELSKMAIQSLKAVVSVFIQK